MSNWAEEVEEEFYESLNRVLSSSCSSTSNSDEENDYALHQHHLRRSCTPHLPAVSFDVWLSEPGTVDERRRRLRKQMGLDGERSFDRVKPDEGVGVETSHVSDAEMWRSASCNGFYSREDSIRIASSAGVISRSRSDGSVEHGTEIRQQLRASDKPPLVARSWLSLDGDVERSVANSGSGSGKEETAKRFTIKNLDNGKEFVMKDFLEDGMWNNVREVGTGKQFTMKEFEVCIGSSPIVQELMRRQNVVEKSNGISGPDRSGGSGQSKVDTESSGGGNSKRKSSWLRSLKNAVTTAGQRDRRSSDEKDTSSEKGGRRSSSATDDSQDMPQILIHGPERMKVRQYGKSHKELSGLFLIQEIQAHNGSIWTIKFSSDGRYMASAGEDCVIHAWQVLEHDKKPDLLLDRTREENPNGSPLPEAINNGSPVGIPSPEGIEGNYMEKKRREKDHSGRKPLSMQNLMVPEQVFALSEKPIYSFAGHLDDVLDLSWSKSQYLLSSSMDKTVRLWHFSSNSCLKVFSHSDYVTCIQFNPVDDRHFISGSLDAKVRLWSIPHRQIVDWNDMHEMVTAVCYTPDGQGALVGSHKGNCHLFDTSDNKLLKKTQIDLHNKKKKSNHKKITGFQYAPGSTSEVLITSADSRVRVHDGVNVIHKFKGFRNTSSQISASLTDNGRYIVCASEDSNVYVWRNDDNPNRSKGAITTQSYEYFHCQDATVAVPWPNPTSTPPSRLSASKPPNGNLEFLEDAKVLSATWREEKLPSGFSSAHSSSSSSSEGDSLLPSSRLAWGMVIVAASRSGDVRVYQNFGLPVRV